MQLAFAVAGAAIGSAMGWGFTLFGAAFTGAQVGWALGSVVGGALFPGGQDITQTGPRLDDLSVRLSSYGQPVSRVFGTIRVPAPSFWSTGLIETATTTTQEGGKGGGGSVTTTTYSYAASFATALCDGQIQGVRRIWADSKLISDVGASASLGALMASSDRAKEIRLYLGSETQGADPLIQSYEGAANTPAFRGRAFPVFDTLQLADFGNRIPSISAEVVASSSPSYAVKLQTTFAGFPAYPPDYSYTSFDTTNYSLVGIAGNFNGSFNRGVVVNGVYEQMYAVGDYLGAPLPKVNLRWLRNRYTAEGVVFRDLMDYQPDLDDYEAGNGPYPPRFVSTDENATIIASSQTPAIPLEYLNFDRRARAVLGNSISFCGLDGQTPTAFSMRNSECLFAFRVLANAPALAPAALTGDVAVFRFTPNNTAPTLLYLWPKAGVAGGLAQDAVSALYVTDNYWFLALQYRRTGDPTYFTEEIKRFALQSGTPADEWTSLGTSSADKLFGVNYQGARGWYISDELAPVMLAHTADGTVNEWNAGTVTEVGSGVTSSGTRVFPSVWAANGDILVHHNDAAGAPNYVEWLGRTVSSATVTRQSVLAALFEDAGLTASDYDVSAVSGNCRGYMVPRVMPVRDAIMPLLAGWLLDAVESDGKIKIVPRGGASAATLATTDLAARAAGEDPPPVLDLTRDDDTDLPVELQVRYFNADRDYQQGAQYARRLVSGAIGQASLDLAIVLTDDEAKQIADAQLYALWANRSRVGFRTSRAQSRYEPGDVLTLPQGSDSLEVRVTRRDDGANGVIAWEGVLEDASVYTQSSTGVSGQAVAQDIAIAGATMLELMDTVTLRNQDDGACKYAAACGLLSGWESAQLFESSDEGQSYAAAALLSDGAIGYTTTALGSWDADDNRWDLHNSVTFTLYNDTALSSATEAQVYNGANALLVGDEVIQYQTPVDNGNRSWTVSVLLRYRKGSEGVQTGAHSIGERVVVLEGARVTRVADELADINVERRYKAVTIGRTLASAEEERFTNTGNSLKPLRVANVGAARDVSSNLSVWWFDRERVNAEWRDLADVPSAEDSLSYEVDVRNAGDTATLRTITAAAMPTPAAPVSYTAAQQTTDFGAPPGTVILRIYKLSAQVGRGFVRAVTV